MSAGDAFGPTVRFVGLDFSRARQDEILGWLKQRRATDRFAYVVTPNADHVVRLFEQAARAEIPQAYRQADLCLNDSKVMALLARMRSISIPVTPGSDLIEAFLRHEIEPGRRILLVGGAHESAELLRQLLPHNEVLQHQPPMGLLNDEKAMDACVRFVTDHPSDYALFAVGSPQQELIAFRVSQCEGATGTGLCIGAAIDFITGRAQRAPVWMRRLALEWLHRLLTNPRRLWRRYLLHSPRAIWIALTR